MNATTAITSNLPSQDLAQATNNAGLLSTSNSTTGNSNVSTVAALLTAPKTLPQSKGNAGNLPVLSGTTTAGVKLALAQTGGVVDSGVVADDRTSVPPTNFALDADQAIALNGNENDDFFSSSHPLGLFQTSVPKLDNSNLLKSTSTGSSTLIADTRSANLGRNTITVPYKWPDTLAVGTPVPGIGLPGAPTGLTGYVLWSNKNTLSPTDDKLTFFGSLPLPSSIAGVAGWTPVVANILTQMGGPKLAARADLLSGALFTQYKRLEQVLNSPSFKALLPPGTKVIPTLVGSIPVDEAAKITVGGHSQLDKAELGLGFTIVMPGTKDGNARAGTGTAFFINSRQNLKQLLEGENPLRSLNFGGLALNVPIKGQKVNIGPAWRATVEAPTNGPWQIAFADSNEKYDMPDAFAMVANAMFGRNAPLSGTGFGPFSEIVNKIPPETLEALGTVGNVVVNGAEHATTVGTLVKLFGRTGGIAASLAVFSAEAIHNHHEDQVRQTIQYRTYVPSAALKSMRDFDPMSTNIGWQASILQNAITQAITSEQVDARGLRDEWQAVLDGKINGGLTGRDLQAGRLLAATLLGRKDDIERLSQLLYPYDNPYQGGVRPRNLDQYAVPQFVTPTGAQQTGYRNYEAGLYGGKVVAIPSQPDDQGQAIWQVTATTGDGRTATVNVALTGQFGPEQLTPISPTKRRLDQLLAAQSDAPKEEPRGYVEYRGRLYGGSVVAIPSQPDDRGQAIWQVTATTGNGRTVTVNVPLTGQFGPEQLTPDSPTKEKLDRALGIPRGYVDYTAGLYGGTVTAVSSQPDDRGKALWQVTAVTGDGRRVSVNVWLTGQFGPDQLTPGSPTKKLLDQALAQTPQAGYRTYEAGLYGGKVVAVPSQPDDQGRAIWHVTVYPGDGRPTVSVDVTLTGQFGPEQLTPGSPTKNLLNQALRSHY